MTLSSARFSIQSTKVNGAKILKRKPIRDVRGAFERLFCKDEYDFHDLAFDVRQINLSRSVEPGTVRGIHLQHSPAEEKKIISCVSGAVWDVVVDLRFNSSTYGQWDAIELSEDNDLSLFIPRGCGHCFQALNKNSKLIYFHSHDYKPRYEGGVNPLDPDLNISWPLPVVNLSERDGNLPSLTKFKELQG